jgi:hypothetical protein
MGRMFCCLAIVVGIATGGSAITVEPTGQAQFVEVKATVVRVNVDDQTIILRVGDGDQAKEVQYKVDQATRYWGTTKQPLSEGLRYPGFTRGTEVWFRTGPGADNRTLTELRLNYLDPSGDR